MKTDTILKPVQAWRSWKVDVVKGKIHLRGVAFPILWKPDVEMEAHCFVPDIFFQLGFVEETSVCVCRNADEDREVPSLLGFCGLYASLTPQEAAHPDMGREFLRVGRVVGKVNLWGNIWQHKKGYRAQYAYPASFEFAVCAFCHKIVPLRESLLIEKTLPSNRNRYISRDPPFSIVCSAHSHIVASQWSRSWSSELEQTYL